MNVGFRALVIGPWSLGFGDSPDELHRDPVHLRHHRVYLALLPSGPDAVRRLKSHRVRAAVRLTKASV